MTHQTVLYDCHVAHQARMVDFSGWNMPVYYSSQIKEHLAVRQDKGMFDVSHMLAIDIEGDQAEAFLCWLLANDIRKAGPGRALYTCMLNEQSGIVDDLIVYHYQQGVYRAIVNAGNRYSDYEWMRRHAGAYDVTLRARTDLAIIAVQGPNAREAVHHVLPAPCVTDTLKNLSPFGVLAAHNKWMIARTGYTGEDGYEIVMPEEEAEKFWEQLYNEGVTPVGLGARDTLRLEAGLNLYGADMDHTTTPYACNLGWTVALSKDRDFVGKQALNAIDRSHQPVMRGVILEGKGILRSHSPVVNEKEQTATLTSGSYAPSLGQSIGLVRMPPDSKQLTVTLRGRQQPLTLVKPPFVRNGKIVYKTL